MSAASRPREGFFGRWRLSSGRLNTLLTTNPADLRGALDEVVNVLISLADRHPDKVLFQILRHDQTKLQSYGVSHSLHCAAVCCLTGKRMGWDDNQRRMLVSAAMSMTEGSALGSTEPWVSAVAPGARAAAIAGARRSRSRERGFMC